MPKTPRLRELRERATLSQEELKERSGISRATIADLEAGNRGAQPRTIRRLAEALGVEPSDLYGDLDYPKAEAPPSQQLTLNGLLAEERRYRPNDRDIEALEQYLSKVERQLENGKMQRVEVEHELDVLRAFGPPTYAASGDEIANRILDLGYELLEQGRHLKLREIAEAEASVGRLDELREQRAS